MPETALLRLLERYGAAELIRAQRLPTDAGDDVADDPGDTPF